MKIQEIRKQIKGQKANTIFLKGTDTYIPFKKFRTLVNILETGNMYFGYDIKTNVVQCKYENDSGLTGIAEFKMDFYPPPYFNLEISTGLPNDTN